MRRYSPAYLCRTVTVQGDYAGFAPPRVGRAAIHNAGRSRVLPSVLTHPLLRQLSRELSSGLCQHPAFTTVQTGVEMEQAGVICRGFSDSVPSSSFRAARSV